MEKGWRGFDEGWKCNVKVTSLKVLAVALAIPWTFQKQKKLHSNFQEIGKKR